jgi:cytochrome c
MKAVPMIDARLEAARLAVARLAGARLAVAALAATFVSLPAQASPELARSKNCVACHHAERRMIGPSWTAIAARYANDANAAQLLGTKVVAGGSGNWGQMPMPAQANLSPDEVDALVRYILSHK